MKHEVTRLIWRASVKSTGMHGGGEREREREVDISSGGESPPALWAHTMIDEKVLGSPKRRSPSHLGRKKVGSAAIETASFQFERGPGAPFFRSLDREVVSSASLPPTPAQLDVIASRIADELGEQGLYLA